VFAEDTPEVSGLAAGERLAGAMPFQPAHEILSAGLDERGHQVEVKGLR